MNDSLGDRIKKNYENRNRQSLIRRMPVMIRVDGRAFHTFTKDFQRPFDRTLIRAMQHAAAYVANEISGCVAYYVQSDEATFFVTDYATHETQAWFDYDQSKLESITASAMTAAFNHYLSTVGQATPKLALFDSRAFNIPKEEVANAFLWRMRDWERNSVSMLAMSKFKHWELDGKNQTERLAMLREIGVEWDDLPYDLKFGHFAVKHEVVDEDKGAEFVPWKYALTYFDVAGQLQDWT